MLKVSIHPKHFVVVFIALLLIFTSSTLYLLAKLDRVGKVCNPNYSGCVTAETTNCSSLGHSVRVTGVDVYSLDRDGDGVGCEPSKWRESNSKFTLIGFFNIAATGLSAFLAWRAASKITRKTLAESSTVDTQGHPVISRAIVSVGLCPDCGSDLVVRKGKYGSFTGCSSFPGCRYVKRKSSDKYDNNRD